MLRLVVASRNEGKVHEISRLLTGLPVDVLPIANWPDATEVEETGTSFLENAQLKAAAAASHTGRIALADDSGLEVDALGGLPGIYSARFAGPQADDEANRTELLRRLRGVGPARRTARFRCALVLAAPQRVLWEGDGTCSGWITTQPEGENGFGYDPVFRPAGEHRTFAEMPASEKDAASHRGKALRAFRNWLSAALTRLTRL